MIALGQRNSSGNRRSSHVSLISCPLCRSAFLTIYGNHSSKVTVCFRVRIPILTFDRMKCHRHLSFSQVLEGAVNRYPPSSAIMIPRCSALESTGQAPRESDPSALHRCVCVGQSLPVETLLDSIPQVYDDPNRQH